MNIRFFKAIIPKQVRVLCWNYDAWVVGSQLDKLDKQKDWDLIVEPIYWNSAACFLAQLDAEDTITPNRFGGWKIETPYSHIDVWPSTINEYIRRMPKRQTVKLFQPKSKIFLVEKK